MLISEDRLNNIWKLGKGGKRRKQIAVSLMSCNDVARLYLLVEQNWINILDEFREAFPGVASRVLSKAGGIGREGCICELLFVFGDFLLELAETELCLDLGNTGIHIFLEVGIDIIERVIILTPFFMSSALLLESRPDFVLLLWIYTLAATEHVL
jgi:hypothetical protein